MFIENAAYRRFFLWKASFGNCLERISVGTKLYDSPSMFRLLIFYSLGPFHLKVWGGEERKLIKNSPPPPSSPSSEFGGGGEGGKAIQNSPPPPPEPKKILSSPPNTVSRSVVSVKKCRHGTSGRYRETAKIAQVVAKYQTPGTWRSKSCRFDSDRRSSCRISFILQVSYICICICTYTYTYIYIFIFVHIIIPT